MSKSERQWKNKGLCGRECPCSGMGTPVSLAPDQHPVAWSKSKAMWKGEFWYLRKEVSENSSWNLCLSKAEVLLCWGTRPRILAFEPPLLILDTEPPAKKTTLIFLCPPSVSPKVSRCRRPWCNLLVLYLPVLDTLTSPTTQRGIWNQFTVYKKSQQLCCREESSPCSTVHFKIWTKNLHILIRGISDTGQKKIIHKAYLQR